MLSIKNQDAASLTALSRTLLTHVSRKNSFFLVLEMSGFWQKKKEIQFVSLKSINISVDETLLLISKGESN